MNEMKDLDINIYQYTDFREFLKSYYELMKKETSYFSYRYFSKLAGFSSPNFFKLVADGKRNLSADGIERFTKALKLNQKEKKYFRLLVLMNQADTEEEKEFFTRQIFKTKSYKSLQPLTEAQYDYYAKWYHIPLRELVERSDFNDDPNWIARQFLPPIKESEAKQGLETLIKLGFIEKTEDGSYRQTSKGIQAGGAITVDAYKIFQKKMVEMGAESIDRFHSKDRNVSSVTLGVSEETYNKMTKMIDQFRKELIAMVGAEEPVEKIAQFNLQIFPLMKDISEETDK